MPDGRHRSARRRQLPRRRARTCSPTHGLTRPHPPRRRPPGRARRGQLLGVLAHPQRPPAAADRVRRRARSLADVDGRSPRARAVPRRPTTQARRGRPLAPVPALARRTASCWWPGSSSPWPPPATPELAAAARRAGGPGWSSSSSGIIDRGRQRARRRPGRDPGGVARRRPARRLLKPPRERGRSSRESLDCCSGRARSPSRHDPSDVTNGSHPGRRPRSRVTDRSSRPPIPDTESPCPRQSSFPPPAPPSAAPTRGRSRTSVPTTSPP